MNDGLIVLLKGRVPGVQSAHDVDSIHHFVVGITVSRIYLLTFGLFFAWAEPIMDSTLSHLMEIVDDELGILLEIGVSGLQIVN